MTRKYLPPFIQKQNVLIIKNLDTSIINAKVKRKAAYVRKTMKHAVMKAQHASQKIACAHVVVKCANCNKNHQSNDENCEMVLSLNVRKSTDELAAL